MIKCNLYHIFVNKSVSLEWELTILAFITAYFSRIGFGNFPLIKIWYGLFIMEIIKKMTGDKFYILNKRLLLEIGIDATLLLSELALCQEYYKDWFFKSQEHIKQETTLSAKVQNKALKILKDKGLVKTKKYGMPLRLYYFVDANAISKLLPNVETSLSKKEKQDATKGKDKIIQKGQTLINNTNKEIINKEIYINISQGLQVKIEEYFEYRKEIKKPFKSQKSVATKIKEFISQSEKYGEQAVFESIDQAISNGWQGTFIDKKYLTKNQNNNETKQQQTYGFIQRVTDFEL